MLIEILEWRGQIVICVNDKRVSGPKPLGGAPIIAQVKITQEQVKKLITQHNIAT